MGRAGALVMIGGISLITRRSRLSSDTAIGLPFIGMLALRVVIVSRSTSFTGDLVRVLFADVLVLDEPTASLDAAGREIYAQVMDAELARGAAITVATHDIREAARCDQVMLMARRVIALGAPSQVVTPEALLETFGIILMSQGREGSLAVIPCEHGHDCD